MAIDQSGRGSCKFHVQVNQVNQLLEGAVGVITVKALYQL